MARNDLTMSWDNAIREPFLGVTAPDASRHPEFKRLTLQGTDVADLPLPLDIGFRARGQLQNKGVPPSQVLRFGRTDAAVPSVEAALSTRDRMRETHSDMLAMSKIGLEASRWEAEAHATELEKAVPFLGWTSGWGISPGVQPRDVAPIPQVYWTLLDESFSPQAAKATLKLKRGTTHGHPTFISGDIDHIAHLAMAQEMRAAGSVTKVRQIIAQMNALTDLSWWPDEIVAVTSMRTQGSRKHIPWVETDDEGPFEVGTTKGMMPKNRRVQMVPTYFNETVRPEVEAEMNGLKGGPLGPCFKHGSAADTNAKIFDALDRAIAAYGADAAIFTDDAANFDDSTDVVHMEADIRNSHMPQFQKDLLRMHLTSPVLSSPRKSTAQACLYSRRGGVLSGTIDTSFTDSRINYCVAAACCAAATGVTDAQMKVELKAGRTTIFVQGDDTLIVGRRVDKDKYSARGRELGYERVIEQQPIFLKVWHGARGLFYTLPSRAYISSYYRERRAPGPLHELLGIAIRFDLCWKSPLSGYFWRRLCSHHPLLNRGTPTPQHLLRVIGRETAALEEERRTPQGADQWLAFVSDLAKGDADFVEAQITSGEAPDFWPFVFERLGGLKVLAEQFMDFDITNPSNAASSFDWRHYVASLAAKWQR